MSSPFDITKNLIQEKKDMPFIPNDYQPVLINRILSMNIDLIFYVNEMNCNPWLPKKLQHDFYFYAIVAKKRWAEYSKLWKKAEDEEFTKVQEHFGMSDAKTRDALRVLKAIGENVKS